MSNELIDAIYEEDQKSIARLLSKGCDPNTPVDGDSPFVEACSKSSTVVAKQLIKAGADVNRHDNALDDSPLTAACDAAILETVKLLVAHGADVNYLLRNVESPLSKAASGKDKARVAIVQFLLEHGAYPKAVFHSRAGAAVGNVLMVACEFGLPEVVELLIVAGAPINEKFLFGTALIAAVRGDKPENVEVLLRHGADPLISTDKDSKLLERSGRNAIELAKFKKRKKILAVFKKYGHLK